MSYLKTCISFIFTNNVYVLLKKSIIPLPQQLNRQSPPVLTVVMSIFLNTMEKIEENYEKEEKKIQEKLIKCQNQREIIESRHFMNPRNFVKTRISMIDAKNRNSQFLKDLEISKARLRTLTSFSPTDEELRERIIAYRKRIN